MKKASLFSANFEADNLPFGPVEKPVLLLDIANAIRAFGGEIWHFDKIEAPAGSVFRANIGRRQFRVFAPMPGLDPQPTAPTEKGTPCHVITTLPDLQIWLEALAAA